MIVEIVKTPNGEAPDWVREAWVGLRVPCLEDKPVDMPAIGALSGPGSKLGQVWFALRGKVERRTGYVVKARDVVGLLALSNEDAARWWIENVPHVMDDGQLFMFEQSCCRPIDWTA